MSPQAQRIAIAEACGKSVEAFRFWWKSHGGQEWRESPHYRTKEQAEEAREGGFHWSEVKPVESVRSCENIPRYHDDLNAIHGAEKMLTPEQKKEYNDWLDELGGYYAWEATAAQRSEALLRTLNLWDYTK